MKKVLPSGGRSPSGHEDMTEYGHLRAKRLQHFLRPHYLLHNIYMSILFEFHDSIKLISTVIINTKIWVFHSMLRRTNNPFLLLQTIQLLKENDLFEVLPIIYKTLIAILAFQHFTTFLILHRHLKIFHLILSDESLKQGRNAS